MAFDNERRGDDVVDEKNGDECFPESDHGDCTFSYLITGVSVRTGLERTKCSFTTGTERCPGEKHYWSFPDFRINLSRL